MTLKAAGSEVRGPRTWGPQLITRVYDGKDIFMVKPLSSDEETEGENDEKMENKLRKKENNIKIDGKYSLIN